MDREDKIQIRMDILSILHSRGYQFSSAPLAVADAATIEQWVLDDADAKPAVLISIKPVAP